MFILDKEYFENREFSFTLAGDIYLRFNSFDSLVEMRKSIIARSPLKIDIGAIYNMKPKDSKKVKLMTFQPIERELVFDIDMTDYDDVRSCCTGTDICTRCWPFMVVAARILEAFLREDFGFKNLLWVYSGRRGIHCWVADERARILKSDARDAIANFINIFDGGHFKAKKVELDGLRGIHPSILRSIQIIDQHFEELMINQQNFLSTKDQIETVINLCVNQQLRNELKEKLNDSKLKSSLDRWKALVQLSQSFYHTSKDLKKDKFRHRYFIEEVKLQLCYPRLDINVTKGLNHLLKVPFSVHPKTGRVCVPIDFKKITTFDPFQVPSVDQLCQVIDQLNESKNDDCKTNTGTSRFASKTQLASSIDVFRTFINTLQEKTRGVLIEKSDQLLDF